jgi:TonB family protein
MRGRPAAARRLVLVGALALAAAPARTGAQELAAAPAQTGAQELAAERSQARLVDAVPRGPDVSERLATIRARIQAALVYPPGARWRRLEGETLVRFAIDPRGTPLQVVVHGSSGHGALDRAAQRAVHAAAPLPWVYGRLEVPVRFELSGRR